MSSEGIEKINFVEKRIEVKKTDCIVNKPTPYLFTSSAFVLSPFARSPLHRNQNFNSSFLSSDGFHPCKEAPGISSSVRTATRVVEAVAMLMTFLA